MDKSAVKFLSPEEEELRRKLAELDEISGVIAEKELELTNLCNSLSHFGSKYFSEVGIKYKELDDINAQIAEYAAKRDPSDITAQKKAEEARIQAERTEEEFFSYEAIKEEHAKDFEPSEEMKKLYRQIAMKIHPDKATEDSEKERRTKLMAELNNAYAEGNIAKMTQILREWESSPESVVGDGVAMKLVRTIRKIAQLKGRLSIIEEEVSEIKISEMSKMMIRVQESEEKGIDLLGELSRKIDEDIRSAKAVLMGLEREYYNARKG
jgi:hypothetical protein